MIAALAVFFVAGLAAFVWQRVRSPASDPDAVTANGTIEGTEITISAKIPGRIASLGVEESERVQRGREIARLDSEDVRARVRAAQAQVDASSAHRVQAESAIAVAESALIQAATSRTNTDATTLAALAQAIAARNEAVARYAEVGSTEAMAEHDVHAAGASLVKARQDLGRTTALVASGDLARAQLDAARAGYEAALAQRDAARRGVDRAREAIVEARAGIAQADAIIGQAKAARLGVALREQDIVQVRARIAATRGESLAVGAQERSAIAEHDAVAAALSDTRILAPIDGTVLRIFARGGETIAAGAPIMTLVDTHKLYVRVYVAEKEVGRIALGAPARITVDAFPGRNFDARVKRIDESAQFTPKTVHTADERTQLVYAVDLDLGAAGDALKPGMIADASIRLR